LAKNGALPFRTLDGTTACAVIGIKDKAEPPALKKRVALQQSELKKLQKQNDVEE
jgi:hypothetical protein